LKACWNAAYTLVIVSAPVPPNSSSRNLECLVSSSAFALADRIWSSASSAAVGPASILRSFKGEMSAPVTRLSSSLGTRTGSRWRISPTCSWQMRRTKTYCAAQAICPHFRKAGGITSASDSGNRTRDRGSSRGWPTSQRREDTPCNRQAIGNLACLLFCPYVKESGNDQHTDVLERKGGVRKSLAKPGLHANRTRTSRCKRGIGEALLHKRTIAFHEADVVGHGGQEGLGPKNIHSACRSRRQVVGQKDSEEYGRILHEIVPATCMDKRRIRTSLGRGLPQS